MQLLVNLIEVLQEEGPQEERKERVARIMDQIIAQEKVLLMELALACDDLPDELKPVETKIYDALERFIGTRADI